MDQTKSEVALKFCCEKWLKNEDENFLSKSVWNVFRNIFSHQQYWNLRKTSKAHTKKFCFGLNKQKQQVRILPKKILVSLQHEICDLQRLSWTETVKEATQIGISQKRSSWWLFLFLPNCAMLACLLSNEECFIRKKNSRKFCIVVCLGLDWESTWERMNKNELWKNKHNNSHVKFATLCTAGG